MFLCFQYSDIMDGVPPRPDGRYKNIKRSSVISFQRGARNRKRFSSIHGHLPLIPFNVIAHSHAADSGKLGLSRLRRLLPRSGGRVE